MTSCRKVNIASEKIINYKVTSPNNHCCQIRILAGERPETSAMICYFLSMRQEHVHVNVLFTLKFLYKDILLRFLDYLNQFKVLYVCVDVTVLI